MAQDARWIEVVVLWDGWSRRATLDAELVVGRAPSCDVVVPDGTVSRRHALLWRQGEAVMIEDLGSNAGTWVDGRRLEAAQELVPGTVVTIGPARLSVFATTTPPLLSGDVARDRRNLDLLLAAVADLQVNAALDGVSRAAVDGAVALANGDRGALLLDAGSQLAAARDRTGDADGAWTRSLPRRALETRRPVLVADTELAASARDAQPRAVLCVPVPGAEAPVGVLCVDCRTAVAALGVGEIALMNALAAQVALALERVRRA